MPPSRPQDPRTLKIRDEEDQIKTLGPLSRPPGPAPEEAEATVFPGADATVAPGELEAPKPKSMVRGGAALTRPPVSDNEPATAPGKISAGAIAPPRAAGAGARLEAPSPKEAREVPVLKPRTPTETVLRPRTEVKRKSSWVVWVFAFLVLGGIGFGVSWFLINPSAKGPSAPEAANAAPEPAVNAVPSPDPDALAEDAAEPDTAAAPEVAGADTSADGEPNAAPLPTEIAGVDAVVGAADEGVESDAAVADDVQVAAVQVDGSAEPAEPTEPQPVEAADAAAQVAEAAAPVEPDAPATPPEPVVAPMPPRNPAESNRLNEAGLAARKAGDHTRATQLYTEALRFNPDSVWARYNLACEFALAGRAKEAFAELTTLYKLGTPESRKALAAARKDTDFDSIRDSGQFFRLTNF